MRQKNKPTKPKVGSIISNINEISFARNVILNDISLYKILIDFDMKTTFSKNKVFITPGILTIPICAEHDNLIIRRPQTKSTKN